MKMLRFGCNYPLPGGSGFLVVGDLLDGQSNSWQALDGFFSAQFILIFSVVCLLVSFMRLTTLFLPPATAAFVVFDIGLPAITSSIRLVFVVLVVVLLRSLV